MQFSERALSSYNRLTSDPKRKNYFDITATLVLIILLLTMIYPAVQHILNLNNEITAGKIVEVALDEKITQLEQAKENLAEVKEDLPLLELALPNGSSLKTYLGKPVEQLAQKHNLTIKAVQFADVPISDPQKDEATTLKRIEYQVTFGGNFVSFSNLVKDLENYIRITYTDKIEVKKADSSEPTMTINATAYFMGNTLVPASSVQEGN